MIDHIMLDHIMSQTTPSIVSAQLDTSLGGEAESAEQGPGSSSPSTPSCHTPEGSDREEGEFSSLHALQGVFVQSRAYFQSLLSQALRTLHCPPGMTVTQKKASPYFLSSDFL